MTETRFQSRVGLFVAGCLALTAVLLLAFSKSTGWWARTYEIQMRLSNVGGIKERAPVLLAGVQVGSVRAIKLAPDGKSVILHLRILEPIRIHGDAEFVVEQVGVLGDQFVCIYPKANATPPLRDGAVVQGTEALNFQEVARSAGEVLQRIGALAEDIHALAGGLQTSVSNLNAQVITPQTLSNVAATIANFHQVSERTLGTISKIETLVETNRVPLQQSVTNVMEFTARLKDITSHLEEAIATNRGPVRGAVENFRDASVAIKHIAADLEAGRGLAGSLLKDRQLQTDLSLTASNLAVLSSNLSRYGLFWKPRPAWLTGPRTNRPAGKSPF